MRCGSKSALLTAGSLAIVIALTGCAGRSAKQSSAPAPSAPAVATATPAKDTPSVPTAMPVAKTEAAPAPSANGFVEQPALADVRFRPGLVTVGRADATALDAVVRWLKENPRTQVRIEGHTDDRGHRAENLTVGEKRATSVMKYLVAKGVEAERISIVSYGSDRPICTEQTEACRAKNRRAHFQVKQP
jgi:peptidoglycan-associated lipoprotein